MFLKAAAASLLLLHGLAGLGSCLVKKDNSVFVLCALVIRGISFKKKKKKA